MNHDLRAALERLTACRAELAKRTEALAAANARLAAFLRIDAAELDVLVARRRAPKDNRGANFGGAL